MPNQITNKNWHGYIFNFRPAFKPEPDHNHVSCHLYGLCHLVHVQSDLRMWCIRALFVWLCGWAVQMDLYFKWSLQQQPLTRIYLSLTFSLTNMNTWRKTKNRTFPLSLDSCTISRTVDFLGHKHCKCTVCPPWLIGHGFLDTDQQKETILISKWEQTSTKSSKVIKNTKNTYLQ